MIGTQNARDKWCFKIMDSKVWVIGEEIIILPGNRLKITMLSGMVRQEKSIAKYLICDLLTDSELVQRFPVDVLPASLQRGFPRGILQSLGLVQAAWCCPLQ